MNPHADEAFPLDTLTEISWTQLLNASGLPEPELRELVQYGALVPRDPDAPVWTFESHWLVVARRASRLRHDFELDAHGVSVVLSFVERIESLEFELQAVRARAG
jgi:chaperone modulatory protein CbpM